MRNKIAPNWFPFWIDKWLWGSTRHELKVDERAVFVDLMALAQKDGGFIRANAGYPYPPEQLAGILCIDKELLLRTVARCIEVGKLERLDDGSLRLCSFDKYITSERHRRRINAQLMAEKADTMSGYPALSETKRNETKRKDRDIKADNAGPLFESLWTQWPQKGRFKKKICRAKFEALVKRGEYEAFRSATLGYSNYLLHKKENEGFAQSPMHLATWLNNWKGEMERYVDKNGEPFKYKPRL